MPRRSLLSALRPARAASVPRLLLFWVGVFPIRSKTVKLLFIVRSARPRRGIPSGGAASEDTPADDDARTRDTPLLCLCTMSPYVSVCACCASAAVARARTYVILVRARTQLRARRARHGNKTGTLSLFFSPGPGNLALSNFAIIRD